MNHKVIVAAIAAMYLTTGGLTFAQGNSDRNRGEQGQRNGQQNGHDNHGRGPQDKHYNERGAGPNHSYYRGDRMPAEYRHRQYVVNDWRSHHLSAPPRGQQWVQSGGDYVLVAIATGIVMNLLLNN